MKIYLTDKKKTENVISIVYDITVNSRLSTTECNFFRPRVFSIKTIKNLKISVQNVSFKRDRLSSSDIIFTKNEIFKRMWTKI